jgi:hypothetical protein
MRKSILFAMSLLWSGLTYSQPMSEPDLIAMAKQLMNSKNDISTIELNNMYGHDKLIILPFSGFVWSDVLQHIPPQFLLNLTTQFKTRNSVDDLIVSINNRYQNTSYEESNSLVTRTNNDYVFCLVDDGLRKEFENKNGVMKPFFAGLMPLYFQRDDLFDFVRHHESSHCLDDEFYGTAKDQKFLSVLINETRADLTAALVSANKNGNYDLFYKLIRPMRMASVFDIEHTTEDAVASLLSTQDASKLHGLDFSEIMRIRSILIQKLETPEYLRMMLKNCYEKEQIGLYLVQKFRQTGQHVDVSIQGLLAQNQDVLDTMVPEDIVKNADLDKRYNDMVISVMENHQYYHDYIDFKSPQIDSFKRNLESFGVQMNQNVESTLKNNY